MRGLKFAEQRMEIQVLECYTVLIGAITDVPKECAASSFLSEQCRI